MLIPSKSPSILIPHTDIILTKSFNNINYTIEFMIAQEEELIKLTNFDRQPKLDIDLTTLPDILNNDIQASLPSKNSSIAPMFSNAGSQLHFDNHAKLAEYSRLHDKYWRTYLKLVDLIPADKHQYSHNKVKCILKASVFADSRFSNSYKKLFIEFMISYETLERKLFHWLSPSYESLLSLYGSFNRSEYGIAIAVNDHYSIMGSNVILSIREVHNSDIPIHVYYNGDSDLDPLNQNMLRSLAPGVELHDLTIVIDNSIVKSESFATKVFAQLLTPAQHVMLLDADAVLLQSPEHAFKHPGYENKGTLFFLDRQFLTAPLETVEWFLSMVPDKISDTKPPERLENHPWLTGKSKYIQESGMVIIDKIKHLTPLLSAALLNKKIEREVTYNRVYGDKETFWIGFEIIGRPYFFSPYEPHPIGDITYYPREEEFAWDEPKRINDNSKPDVFCSCHMLHFDYEAKPFWINGGLWVRKDHPDELGLLSYNSYASFNNSKWSLQDFNTLSYNNIYSNGAWSLFDGVWGCYKSSDNSDLRRPLEPEYQRILKLSAQLYMKFYNNTIINPSKNL